MSDFELSTELADYIDCGINNDHCNVDIWHRTIMPEHQL